MGALNESISLYRTALSFDPENRIDRVSSLYSLASTLLDRFKVLRNSTDLEESLAVYSTSLALSDKAIPDRSSILTGFAEAYYTRFEEEGRGEDFEQCIRYMSQAATNRFSDPIANINDIFGRLLAT